MQNTTSNQINQTKIRQAFECARYVPENELAGTLYETLQERTKKIKRVRLSVFSLVGLLSLATLIPVLISTTDRLARSGFFSYLSLLYSDGLVYWREISYSLLESLPLVGTTLTFALLFIFIFSLKHSVRQLSFN